MQLGNHQTRDVRNVRHEVGTTLVAISRNL